MSLCCCLVTFRRVVIAGLGIWSSRLYQGSTVRFIATTLSHVWHLSDDDQGNEKVIDKKI